MSRPSHNGEVHGSDAPGKPGIPPTWAVAAKSAVGCAISAQSPLWFTLSRGIVTEIFHPWVDHAALRDFGFIVTAPDGFFSEEQHDAASSTQPAGQGIPAYRVENKCSRGRYRIVKQIISDPQREVLLQRVKITALKGRIEDLRLFALLSPRLGDQGKDNTGWVGHFHSWEALMAQRQGHSLALVSSAPWLRRSVGYVGISDAWQDLRQHGQMIWAYQRAEHGHIALAGEIDIQCCGGEFVTALGFDRSADGAAVNAIMALNTPFEISWDQYIKQWKSWHKTVTDLDDKRTTPMLTAGAEHRRRPDRSRPRVLAAGEEEETNLFRTSMMVLRAHRSKQYAGAAVASLATPWGDGRGDDDLGGYHLVWPRDLSEEAMGLLAGGAVDEVQGVLDYLRATQKATGGWAQDMWLEGTAYGKGVQLDESALPVLLVDLAARESVLGERDLKALWPMVRNAARFMILSGPRTGEDRWENTPGLTSYTLAAAVAALIVAAKMGDKFGQGGEASYFRETADLWNDQIEPWTYVTGTALAKRVGVEGYYVRIAPSPGMRTLMRRGPLTLEKQAHGLPTEQVVSPDALALVRFGLRAPDDPRILNTVKVIDAVTRVKTPAGPCWHRYNGDYYGEHEDGADFHGHGDKSGFGRAWPLLTGERGHFELAAGRSGEARQMLITMGSLASQIGLIPEQVWDTADLPDHDLYRGRPSGSAMPLAWAHSEYVRLVRSIRDGEVFDLPVDAYERYVKRKTTSDLALWRFDHQVEGFDAGRRLRIEVKAPAVVRYSMDNWATAEEAPTRDTGCGLHIIDLPTGQMGAGDRLSFTFRWPKSGNRWEEKNFDLTVEQPSPGQARGDAGARRPAQRRATAESRS